MKKINLLKKLPKPNRKKGQLNRKTKKNLKHIEISRKYGKDYFDGSRMYGYGGYSYDGRWIPVAKDIKKILKLKKGSKVLDIGCAKGFLVKDLVDIGIDAYGLDISEYAIKNCHPDVIGRLHLGNQIKLPFNDNTFDCVLSINTLHNLTRKECLKALFEINRVNKTNNSFIQVDSFRNINEQKVFKQWVLTAKFYDYPSGWLKLFKEANYKGYYDWTII